MTYVTLVIAVFVLAFGAWMMLLLKRRRVLMQRVEESVARQKYQLDRLDRLTKLFASKTRPVAEFEAEARVLIAEMRMSDTDGQIEPVIFHFESELAARL